LRRGRKDELNTLWLPLNTFLNPKSRNILMKDFTMEYDFYKFLVTLTLPSLLILLIVRVETGRDIYAIPLFAIGCLFVYSTIVLALVLNAKHKLEQEQLRALPKKGRK
jgi:predicted permease